MIPGNSPGTADLAASTGFDCPQTLEIEQLAIVINTAIRIRSDVIEFLLKRRIPRRSNQIVPATARRFPTVSWTEPIRTRLLFGSDLGPLAQPFRVGCNARRQSVAVEKVVHRLTGQSSHEGKLFKRNDDTPTKVGSRHKSTLAFTSYSCDSFNSWLNF